MTAPPSPVPPATFSEVMSALPSAVAVITTRGPAGPMGLTVTSMGPFTADPPSIVLSVDHGSRSCAPLMACERFGVHVLAHDQEDVAMAFVRKSDDKFAGLDWEWHDDVPRLRGAVAYLCCWRDAVFTHHDHTLLIGEILSLERSAETTKPPLLYHQRRFSWRLQDAEAPAA